MNLKRLASKVQSYTDLIIYRIITTILITMLALPAPYLINNIQQAHAIDTSVPEEELDSSIDVATRFNEIIREYEENLSGLPVDKNMILDSFYLLPQNFQKLTNKLGQPRLRVTSRWNASIKLITTKAHTQNTTVTSAIDQMEFISGANYETNSSYGKSVLNCPKNEDCFLRITTKDKNFHLNDILVKVSHAVAYGNYLVFSFKEGYDNETQKAKLGFIDLALYESHLGNEAIPVGEIEVKDLKSSIESLEVVDNQISINGGQGTINKQELKLLSDLHSVHFNFQAGLVNPTEVKGTLPLARSFEQLATKLYKNHEAELASQSSNGKKAMADIRSAYEKMVKELSVNEKKSTQHLKLTEDLKSERFSGDQIIANSSALISIAKKNNQFKSDKYKDHLEESNLFIQNLNKSSTLKSALVGSKSQLQQQNRFFFALRKLGMKAMAPKPQASKAIRSAITSIVGRMAKVVGKDGKGFIHKVAKSPLTTIGLISGAVIGVFAPEAYVSALNAGIDMTSSVLSYFKQVVYNGYGQTFGKAVVNVSNVINPFTLWDSFAAQYINEDQLRKTGIFLTAFIPSLFAALMGWYYTNNGYKLLRDARKPDFKGFTQTISDIIDEDLNELSRAQEERNRSVSKSASKYSEEDTKRVQAHIKAAEMRKKQEFDNSKLVKGYRASIGRAVNKVKSLLSSKELKEDKPKEVERNTWWAIKKFGFSTALFKRSMTDFIDAWNDYAGLRGTCFQFATFNVKRVKVPFFIRFNPVKCSMRALYPRFFKTAIQNEEHLTLPTKLNGGLDGLLPTLTRMLGPTVERLNAFPFDHISPKVQEHDKYQEAVSQFEDDIVNIETTIGDYALKATLEALSRNLKSDKELLELYLSPKGVAKITSETIVNLNSRNKTFFRLYYDSLTEAVMQKVMNKISQEMDSSMFEEATSSSFANFLTKHKMKKVAQKIVKTGEVSAKDYKALKELIISYSYSRGISHLQELDLPNSAEELHQMIDKEAKNPKHEEYAKKGSSFFMRKMPNIVSKRLKHNFTAYLDPTQNGQMNRIATVRRKRQDPHAVSRAMKSETTDMFVTLPIDLAYVMWLSAGIEDPANPLKPIQDVENGANSVYYGSRMMFYSGFISGIISSQMGSAWVKLQQDAFNDDAGNFGKIPKKKDADRSFLRWWVKQYYSPENSMAINYKRSATIAWQNMPNALPNIALWKLLFLGRIDLEAVVLGYSLTFITPLAAFFYKVEQAFELASFYDAKDIPEELIGHPLAQEYIEKESHKRRVKYNIARDILLNPVAEVLGQAQYVSNDLGSRGMLRGLMPDGILPTEHIITAAYELAQETQGMPVVGEAAQGFYESCVDILTNGNPEISEVPDAVKDYINSKYPEYPAASGGN